MTLFIKVNEIYIVLGRVPEMSVTLGGRTIFNELLACITLEQGWLAKPIGLTNLVPLRQDVSFTNVK